MINNLKAHPSFNLSKFIDNTSFSEVVSKSLQSLIQPVVDQMQPIVWSQPFLGLVVSNDLKWNAHIDSVLSKSSKRLYFLIQLKRAGVPGKQLCLFYTTCISSVIEYACQVYHYALPEYLSDDLKRLQRRALRIIHPFLSYSQSHDQRWINHA